MAQTARIAKQYDKDGTEIHPATTVDAIVDMQPDGSAIRLDTILNAMISQGEVTKAMTSGKCLHPDACFANGLNGVVRYNNRAVTATDYVSVSRVAMLDSPTGSGFGIRVTSHGVTSPGRGGVHQVWVARANAVFIQRIVARIPVGFRIQEHYNNQGVGAKFQWLTPQIGTGDWCEYIGCRTCGSVQGTSVFSTGGHVAIYGGDINTPLEWDIALMTSYDATGTGFLVDSNLLNTTKTELETKITATNTEVNKLLAKVKDELVYDFTKVLSLSSSSTSAQVASAFTPIGKSTVILPSVVNSSLYNFRFQQKAHFYEAQYTGLVGYLYAFYDNVADSGMLELCISYYNGAAMLLKIAVLSSGGIYGVDSVNTKVLF